MTPKENQAKQLSKAEVDRQLDELNRTMAGAGSNGEPARNGQGPSTPVDATPPKRKHKATYSTDKRKGGYLVRVQGPQAEKFHERKVPVTRRDGSETVEQLDKLIWSGTDEESGQPVALYSFIQKPRADESIEF